MVYLLNLNVFVTLYNSLIKKGNRQTRIWIQVPLPFALLWQRQVFGHWLGVFNPFTLLTKVQAKALIVALAFALIGCSPKSSEVAEPEELKATLRLTIGSSPHSLDPHQVTDVPGFKVLAALAEPLLNMDYSDFSVEPGVAERWQQSENGLVYQFFLREQARWSNGDPVTAQDFVASFKRVLSANLGNQYAVEFFAIKNAEAFYSGEIEDFHNVGVEALSDDILQITLQRHDPLFLKKLAAVSSAPVHIKSILQHGAIDDPANAGLKPGNFINNGPFLLVDWQINSKIVVKKNPHYWDAGSVKLDEIVFMLTESESAEERLYRAGQIDMVLGGRIPAEKIAYYQKNAPDELFLQTSYATYFYIFNTQKPPFDDARVRKALSLTINRPQLISAILKDDREPAYALALPAGGYVPPKPEHTYDPELARKLLADAGYPKGQGFPEFSLLYNTMDVHRKIAVAIQQMWQVELGVRATLENQEWKVFLDSRQNLNYSVARAGSFSTVGDPVDFLMAFTTGHGMNDTGWSNQQYDQLVNASNQELQDEMRYKLLQQAETIMLQEMPIAPIFYYNSSYLISPRVKGFKLNMADYPNYKGVYLETIAPAQ